MKKYEIDCRDKKVSEIKVVYPISEIKNLKIKEMLRKFEEDVNEIIKKENILSKEFHFNATKYFIDPEVSNKYFTDVDYIADDEISLIISFYF